MKQKKDQPDKEGRKRSVIVETHEVEKRIMKIATALLFGIGALRLVLHDLEPLIVQIAHVAGIIAGRVSS
jgi:hypothetical protein